MTDFTPTTETVRYYASYGNGLTEVEFDRWLREVQASVFDRAAFDCMRAYALRGEAAVTNPYRGEPADMSRTIVWTGTETSAQMIRDAVIETDGRCEYRFTKRLTSLYGDELTIDMPQRIVVLKRGQSITHDTDGWIKSDG